MSTPKKNGKPNPEEVTAAIQSLIAQGKKDGMIRAADLNTQLERLGLPQDKIEEVYDRLEAMNIQVLGPELELDLGDDLDLTGMEEEAFFARLAKTEAMQAARG